MPLAVNAAMKNIQRNFLFISKKLTHTLLLYWLTMYKCSDGQVHPGVAATV